MGWDAVASKKLSPKARAAWEAASARVVKRCGTVDGGLAKGYLDCSDCALALADLTDRNVYTAWPWPRWIIGDLAQYASVPKSLPESKRWAYWSAKEFLKTCAKLGASVRFSW